MESGLRTRIYGDSTVAESEANGWRRCEESDGVS